MAKIEKGKVQFEREETVWGYIRGKAQWAKVLEPGEYGSFEVDLYVEDDVMEDYKSKAEGVAQVAHDGMLEVGKKGTKQDEFHKEKDGKEYLKFKLPAENWKGEPNKVDIYDKHGDKQPEWDKLIGNGSEVIIKYKISPYYMASSKVAGASVRFYAMQVVNLVEYQSGGESGFGDTTGGQADTPSNESEDF